MHPQSLSILIFCLPPFHYCRAPPSASADESIFFFHPTQWSQALFNSTWRKSLNVMSIFSVKLHDCFLVYGTIHFRSQHFLGVRGQNLLKLMTDSSKKLPMEGVSMCQKSWKFADFLHGWSLMTWFLPFSFFAVPQFLNCLNFLTLMLLACHKKSYLTKSWS